MWIRDSIGMLATIPLMAMSMANRLTPYPIAPDWPRRVCGGRRSAAADTQGLRAMAQ